MKLFQGFGQFAGAGGAVAAADFELITNETISGVISLSVDNCFSSTYDHYMIRREVTGTGNSVRLRLRTGGSDDTGSNYRRQNFEGVNTTLAVTRETGNDQAFAMFGYIDTGVSDQFSILYMQSPYLVARTTAFSAFGDNSDSSINIGASSHAHDLATSYDGFTMFIPSGTMTGSVQVYGWKV